jgi:hypothetical protein
MGGPFKPGFSLSGEQNPQVHAVYIVVLSTTAHKGSGLESDIMNAARLILWMKWSRANLNF